VRRLIYRIWLAIGLYPRPILYQCRKMVVSRLYGCAGGSEYKDVPVNDDSRTLPEFHQIMFLVRRNFSEGLWQVVKEGWCYVLNISDSDLARSWQGAWGGEKMDQMENEKEMRNVSRALRFQSITVCSVRPSVNRPAKHVLHVGRFSKHWRSIAIDRGPYVSYCRCYATAAAASTVI